MSEEPPGSERRRTYRRLALYSSLIFMLPATLVGMTLVGYEVDRVWGTGPWGVLLGFVLGSIAALYETLRITGIRKRR
ncbi:MAG TPA: AtpZ/AtpI family protein [Acidobacteriota bacterium]|nr:AtpZ/AtpI family protein [Acidobacteriota bacterium]HRR25917.1 AtpZ/AtpI family protein [Acidobacteriota bacterium]HRR56233.1 AtpZ/AtpI family protein [Acidobacteriota bacterium]HRV08203.1 AtpZ/AtpI family protein [Acidobacteriota bacterium]